MHVAVWRIEYASWASSRPRLYELGDSLTITHAGLLSPACNNAPKYMDKMLANWLQELIQQNAGLPTSACQSGWQNFKRMNKKFIIKMRRFRSKLICVIMWKY